VHEDAAHLADRPGLADEVDPGRRVAARAGPLAQTVDVARGITDERQGAAAEMGRDQLTRPPRLDRLAGRDVEKFDKEIAGSAAPSPSPKSNDQDKAQPKLSTLERARPERQRSMVAQRTRQTRKSSQSRIDRSDVLSADFGYVDLEDLDTAKHLEQTQNLLRSIRNVRVSELDEEIDVTYDKALSRRLLNENIVLRRDAEMQAKFPTKTLLSDLEPILIDIANLPDQAKPEDVRLIKERVQKTEIVAELLSAGLR